MGEGFPQPQAEARIQEEQKETLVRCGNQTRPETLRQPPVSQYARPRQQPPATNRTCAAIHPRHRPLPPTRQPLAKASSSRAKSLVLSLSTLMAKWKAPSISPATA